MYSICGLGKRWPPRGSKAPKSLLLASMAFALSSAPAPRSSQRRRRAASLISARVRAGVLLVTAVRRDAVGARALPTELLAKFAPVCGRGVSLEHALTRNRWEALSV